ncbi:MAG: GtrA family protein [Pseudomonadota bacterium]
MSALLAMLARFGATGIVATLVYLVLAGALSGAGVPTLAASLSAYTASTALSYLGHRRYTFRSGAEHTTALPRFIGVSLIGLALAASLPLAVERYTGLGVHAGFLAVTLAVAAVSFVGMRLAVFRPHLDRSGP